MKIPFNRPFLTGREANYIDQSLASGHHAGDGPLTRRCHAWLAAQLGVPKALLTPSCTAALEMTAILAEVGPGDEVIMPSYTFVSTANAFVLRGATPVFVDIRPDTLNIDERLLESAITPRTKAIVVVHYAGVGCEMDAIMALAEAHGLIVVEDAAQAIMSSYRGRPLGSFGACAALSFHETKNLTCGEGGALLVSAAQMSERAEIIREKGTNRRKFLRGEVDKYTWVDLGSSYLTSEMTAAMLWAQLEEATAITDQRRAIWARYHAEFVELEARERVRRPRVPAHCDANAHIYYLLLPDRRSRDSFISYCAERGVQTPFHYVPLHAAPMGQRVGRINGPMTVTNGVADCLVRLPLWPGLGRDQEVVLSCVQAAVAAIKPQAWDVAELLS